jgi:hypothetical protein
MSAEERVRGRLRVERALARRSLRDASRLLMARRNALARAVERFHARADGGDFIDVADAMMACEAIGARARMLQDQLRQLGSDAEYERRLNLELTERLEPAAI